MEEALELPDWSSGLLVEQSEINCSPPKKPLAQVTLKDGNTQRVSALGRHGAAPPLPLPAFKHSCAAAPVAPVVSQPGHGHDENDTGAAPAAAAPEEAPRSVPRLTHTPSRTGLTARAVRMPSRLGPTPGAKQAAEFVVPSSAEPDPKAPANTGVNLKSILKRLNFSATKGRAATTAVTTDGASAAPAALREAVPSTAAESTIKQLRFDAGATPATCPAQQPAGSRHVSFDAATVGPASRMQAMRPSTFSAGPSWRTPAPIAEEDAGGSSSSSEGGGTPLAGGSVNSARAGHTPYDRRLSSLFRKYQAAGTPELTDAALDELVEDGAVSSPSWKRLSSASVPESIRELSKKYVSDAEGGTPTPGRMTPALGRTAGLAEEATEAAEASTPVQQPGEGSGRSPTLEPTPHHVLNSMMKRNVLYESPTGSKAVADAALVGLPELAPASDAAQANQSGASDDQLSLASAVAQLLGPVLQLTLEEIEADKAAAAACAHAESPALSAGHSPTPSLSSPAEFYGFPVMAAPDATPGASGAGSAARSRSSSVPRDSEGVPLVTPATVTVRRGGYSGGRPTALEGDDPLAANLFATTFSPGDSFGFGSVGGGSPGGGDAAEFGGFAAGSAGQEERPAVQDAATPALVGGASDFSFFPSAAQPTAGAPVEGATPELPAGCVVGTTISPEILGYYEQQEVIQAQQQRTGAGENRRQAAAQTPKVPRSIIKSGRPLNEAGTPVLGHAQRPGAGEQVAPPTVTRELQALMSDLRIDDPSEVEQMGTVAALREVRATGAMRSFLGGLARAVTPVRRSARKRATGRPLEAMLEETGYSYVPNKALMPEDAAPLVEAAEVKAARKAASQASAPSLAGAAGAQQGQPEVSSAPGHGHSAAEVGQQAGEQAAPQCEQSEQHAALHSGDGAQATTPSAEPATTGRRMSLRRLRTPRSQVGTAPGDSATPASPAADVPVAQDASPSLGESPSFAGDALGTAPRSYSFRPSTLKKARQSVGAASPSTPAATRQGMQGGAKEARDGTPQLSPTEQGIRASLRRSARKSRGAR